MCTLCLAVAWVIYPSAGRILLGNVALATFFLWQQYEPAASSFLMVFLLYWKVHRTVCVPVLDKSGDALLVLFAVLS